MRAFLDFEASSLGKAGYPIEVAWAWEDGRDEAWLIRPAPSWTDWDPAAERVHGLTRAELAASGAPHDEVAGRMAAALAGHALYASAPSWDGKWLSLLLRAAGLPRHALRLQDTDVALAAAVRAALPPDVGEEERARRLRRILHRLEEERAVGRPVHRALPDAWAERERWRRAGELAAEGWGADRP